MDIVDIVMHWKSVDYESKGVLFLKKENVRMCHNFVTCQKRKSAESASLEVSTNARCRIASL